MNPPIKLNAIVHIIEARDLSGKNWNKLSDPFVRVSVAGRRQQTEIRRNQLSATWDQVFRFQEITLTRDEYEREHVHVQVFDANTFFKNELIGQFSFSLSKVRGKPAPHRHQIYRKWVVLTNPKEPQEEQGFLLLSVTVLGPGDTPPSHSSHDESGAGPDGSKVSEEKVLRAPVVKRRGYNFALKVFQGEDLPKTDIWGNCDPFIAVKFNGMVLKTPTQRQTTNPLFNHLLVLPIYTPCFSDVVEIQLWDYRRGTPDHLIATSKVQFSDILSQAMPPTWFNFYGYPIDEHNIAAGWLCDLVRRGEAEANAYLGRVMLSLSATLVDKPILEERPCVPIKGPKVETYRLWIDLYQGSNLPVAQIGSSVLVEVLFGPEKNKRKSDWCSSTASAATINLLGGQNVVEFTCSGENSETGLPTEPGKCRFSPIEVVLPSISSHEVSKYANAQLYDVIINVYVKGVLGGASRVGYLRMKPRDIWASQNKPEWHNLKGVGTKAGLSSLPGALLLSASFFPIREAIQDRMPMVEINKRPHQVRAYVYQAKGIATTTQADVESCFLRVSLAGQTAQRVLTSRPLVSDADPSSTTSRGNVVSSTSLCKETRDPVWYETLLINQVDLPEELSLSSDIEISVCLDGKLGSTVIGTCRYPVSVATESLWPRNAPPRWLQLSKPGAERFRHEATKGLRTERNSALQTLKVNALDTQDHLLDVGKVLVKLEVVRSEDANRFPWFLHRWPTVRPVDLHFRTIGFRNYEELKIKYGAIQKPYAELAVQSIPDMNLVVERFVKAALFDNNEAAIQNSELFGRYSDESVADQDEQWDKLSRGKDPAAQSQISDQHVELGNEFVEDLSPDQVSKLEEKIDMLVSVANSTRLRLHPMAPLVAGEQEAAAGKEPKGSTFGTIVWTSKDVYDDKKTDADDEGNVKSDTGNETTPDDHDGTQSEYSTRSSKIVTATTSNAKFTFFVRDKITVNLPTDPHYTQCMQVKLKDLKWWSNPTIASASVQLREFAVPTIYSRDQINSKSLDAVFKVPQFVMTANALQAISSSLYGNKQTARKSPARWRGSTNQTGESDMYGVDEEDKEGDNAEFPHENLLMEYGDGFQYPVEIITNIDEINTTYDVEIVCAPPAIDEEDAEVFGATNLWPEDQEELLRAQQKQGYHINPLEESKELNPLPYHTFKMYRGRTLYDGGQLECASFKALLYATPSAGPSVAEDDFLEHSFAVLDHAPDQFPFPTPLLQNKRQDLEYSGIRRKGDVPAMASVVREPQRVKVRVYVVAAIDLAPHDVTSTTADPYIVLQMNAPSEVNPASGNYYISDRANYKSKTLNPFYGAFYELDAQFPDITQLQVQIWNAGYVNDDLIGGTTVDLEDRWFNPLWQQMRVEGKRMKEFRPIWHTNSKLPQGKLEMWIEVYTPSEAFDAPIIDIRPPTPTDWELRLVVWETRRVPLLEDRSYMDLYITGELSYERIDGEWVTEQFHETDVHTGLRDGRGIFNWRMKFGIQAPCRYPRLKLVVFNRDFFSTNDAIGEANIDLMPLIQSASRTSADVVERARTWVKMAHQNWVGQPRGDVEVQMSLVRDSYAERNMVGNARDKPNKDPFLPEPPRESAWSALFRAFTFKRICCTLTCLLIPIIIIIIIFVR